MATLRQPRLLILHPGASWSTADVFDGLVYGLKHHGLQPAFYRLDDRIGWSHNWLHIMRRKKNKERKELGLELLPPPTKADVIYHAGTDALAMALRKQVDVVLVVSAMLLHPDVIVLMKRAGLRVVVLFTESPYDLDDELRTAAMVDGCWTNERSCVPAFKAVNPNSGYLPHAWHPKKHFVRGHEDAHVASHDVVFVGSGFPERIQWFNSIDWSGIELGLYGTWKRLGLKKELRECVKADQVTNEHAAALYRRAKIGLNLYRSLKRAVPNQPRSLVQGESLSPRAYELAACGAFHLSDDRAEVREVFGDLVPTFRTAADASQLIRQWLADDAGRARVAAALPACVAESSWVERSACVVGDLQRLLQQRAA